MCRGQVILLPVVAETEQVINAPITVDGKEYHMTAVSMGNPHAIGEAFQITNDETLTWNQIYGTIANCLGVELKPYYVSSHFLAATQKYDLLGSLVGDKANSVGDPK